MRSARRIGLVEIVGDEHDRLSEQLLQAEELVLHLAADQGIKRGERLVEEPELRSDGERAGDANALLLTARELAWQVTLPAGEPHELDHFARPLLALRRGTPWISSGKATLRRTERCGSRAKCWNTMPIRCRRSSISSSFRDAQEILAVEHDLAGVGSTRRDRHRTKVDLPEPESPMMTKISPVADVERDIGDGRDQPAATPRRPRRVRGRGAGHGRPRHDRRASRCPAGELDRLAAAIAGSGPGRQPSIQSCQRASFFVIQSATTASTFAVDVDLGDHGVHLSLVSVIAADGLVGARPLVLHAGPCDLPDRTKGLAAVVGGVGVGAPLRVAVAGRARRGELDPLALELAGAQCGA